MNHRLNEPNIWPAPIHQGIPLRSIVSNFNPGTLPYYFYAQQMVDYILYICHKKKLSPRSFQGCLMVSTRFLKKTNRLESVQLICLTSLMMVSKVYDYYSLSMTQIHQISNHSFNNRQIRQMEAKILKTLDYNLFSNCKKVHLNEKLNNQKSFKYSSVYEMLLVILQMTLGLIPKHTHTFYFQITNKVFYLFFHMLYTREFKPKAIEKLCNPKLIVCFIIKISLIILTQSNGFFPQIQWIEEVLKIKENKDIKKFDDQFEQISPKILQIILGKKYQKVKNKINPFYIRN